MEQYFEESADRKMVLRMVFPPLGTTRVLTGAWLKAAMALV